MLTPAKVPAQSVFVTHTITCTVIITLIGATVVVLTGLAIGLGVGLTPDTHCEDGVNCCTTNYECMQNLGYSCINSICSCNSSYPLNSTDGTICGALNWKCSSDSDCRTSIGLGCYNYSCKCSPYQYYDRQLSRCVYLKTYGQDCTNDYECSSTLTCNKPNSTYCDCPFISTSNMCDCNPGYEYYSQSERSCRPLKGNMETCVQSFECDFPLACNGTHCVCQAGYFWNPVTYGCDTQLGYLSTCQTLFDYNSCDDSVGLSCMYSNIFSSLKCMCGGNKYYDGNNTICLNQKVVGGVCTYSAECLSSNCSSITSKCV